LKAASTDATTTEGTTGIRSEPLSE
jgi:hypothetical protein